MHIIYVDDEPMQLKNFQLTAENLDRVDSLTTFDSGSKAIEWAESHAVDTAFLDIEMPGMNGIELAKKLKEISKNIRIIFVTAYAQYALQAFGVNAIGYLLKPYDREDVERELTKAFYVRDIPEARVQIQTMPRLSIVVDGKPLMLGQTKQAELLALFVDRGKSGVTKLDAMQTLWPGNLSESVYWTTMSRLKTELEHAGISDLIISKGQAKCINTEMVDCDFYRMQQGEESAVQNYHGKYLEEYSWAKERKKALDNIQKAKV